jgi:hypothetical protein
MLSGRSGPRRLTKQERVKNKAGAAAGLRIQVISKSYLLSSTM